MWSHYAKNHEGVCVEFNNLKGSPFEKALPVNYAEDYPKLKITEGSKEVFAGVVLTKAAVWEYEREWRILLRRNPEGFYTFPRECLSGVVLGCQIFSQNENLIADWLSQRGSPVTLYRAVKALDKFAVRIEKVREIGPPLM
jgi:hypothetical protein